MTITKDNLKGRGDNQQMEKYSDQQETIGFDINEDDFELPEIRYQPIDVCGMVLKMKSKKRLALNVSRETKQVGALVKHPPTSNQVFHLVSVGGFSSIGIIKYVAMREKIEELYVSTFRIGKPHFEELCKLHKKGYIKQANFITSLKQAGIDSTLSIDYFNIICEECIKRGWSIKAYNNHSKIVLMRTSKNYYIIETSSNLSENPKMEQFTWENDRTLFEWYEQMFKELLK